MFGKGKKEKDIQKVLEGLTPEEKSDLLEALKGEESETQKGNETNENSTNESVNQNVDNVNGEKSNEGATTPANTTPSTEDETQEGNAIPVSEVMLKSDFQKYVEQFDTRFKALEEKNTALENQNKELTNKNDALTKENEDLKAKYENTTFGQYGNKANDDKNNSTTKESFKDYADKYFK